MTIVKLTLERMSLAFIMTLCACGAETARTPSEIPSEELVQSGCSADDECPGGRCVTGIGEGLCTANCAAQADCPEGTICTDTEASMGVCLLSCTSTNECTDHLGSAYACDTESALETDRDVRVCIDSR